MLWAAEKGSVQSETFHGAAASARHHQPRDDRDLDPWALARLARP